MAWRIVGRAAHLALLPDLEGSPFGRGSRMLRSRLFFFIRTRVFSFLSSVERLSVVLMSASLTCTGPPKSSSKAIASGSRLPTVLSFKACELVSSLVQLVQLYKL